MKKKDATLHEKDLVSIWLDIANAYGSIPHKLIFFFLRGNGLPQKWIRLIEVYYNGLWSQSTSKDANSSWHRHEKGIFAGFCISIILFLAGMNVIIEYICNTDVQGFVTSSKIVMPLLRAFMDDLNLLCVNSGDMRILLGRANTALTWAGMEWRASKSRSLVLESGSVSKCEFDVSSSTSSSETIPPISEKPVRFLGKWMDDTISDKRGSNPLHQQIEAGLEKLDKCYLLGVNKVWVLQFLLLQQVRWTITIYDIPISVVEKLEQRISKFIRRWLGFHPTL